MAVCLSCELVEAIANEKALDQFDCGCPAPHHGIIEGDDVVNLPGARAAASDTLAARHQDEVIASNTPPPASPSLWSWREWQAEQAARRLDSRGNGRSS